jgi:polysaccharide biosynthesis protein PslG
MRGRLWAGVQRSAALLLVCILVPLLAACGGTPGPEASATQLPAPAATSAETPPTPVPAITEVPPAATQTDPPTEAPAETPAATEPPVTAEPPATTEPSATTEPVTPTEEASAAPDTATAAPEEAIRPLFGVVAHLYYTDRDRVLQLAENAGFEWIRQQVPWKDTEKADRTFGFDELDQIVESVAQRNQKLLLSVAKSPDFLTGRKDDNGLPLDPNDFGRFVEELARRYKGKVHAIEVWNEQNLAVENGGRVVPEDAARYVEMLKVAYTRIKAVDPTIVVVAGALSSTGVTEPDRAVDDITYLKAMYEYNGGEIRDFDVQGFHPASAANPPETKFPEDPGNAPGWNDHPTHYFRHVENFRQVMVDAGLGDHKIWITEMGWATQNNTPGYEYGNYVSLDQQADYLEGALYRTLFQYSEWVGAVFIWNLNFPILWNEQGNPLHEQASFGLLNPDWSPRPSFTRVQGFINAVKSDEQR